MEKKIFVVDDSELTLNVISVILDGEGYSVKTWNRASGLLENIKRYHPNLILLDLELPDGDGRELCQIIKQEQEIQDIPVIICTGYEDVTKEVEMIKADGVLYKPFDMNQLISLLQNKLQNAA